MKLVKVVDKKLNIVKEYYRLTYLLTVANIPLDAEWSLWKSMQSIPMALARSGWGRSAERDRFSLDGLLARGRGLSTVLMDKDCEVTIDINSHIFSIPFSLDTMHVQIYVGDDFECVTSVDSVNDHPKVILDMETRSAGVLKRKRRSNPRQSCWGKGK